MLKKIAILTAAAGMLSTSMAVLAEGPTVYGRVAFGFKSISGETDAVDSQRIDSHLGSRVGFKGSNDLGNGMSVDYLLEYGAGDSMSQRHANMTLNGSFGQFRLGKQTGVLYRYIGSNSDQSWALGGSEWYAITSSSGMEAGTAGNLNSAHGLRMKNIAAYRFGAGPGGDDPITFDIQIQSVDQSVAKADATFATVPDKYGNSTKWNGLTGEDSGSVPLDEEDLRDDMTLSDERDWRVVTPAVAAKDDSESIDSVTIAAATALGPVKLQMAYMDENGSEATGDRSPNLLSFGFRAPLGSAEVRGHMTTVDPDVDGHDDNEAWGLLVMNDFGGGYSGMIGVGSYTSGGAAGMAKAARIGGLYYTSEGADAMPVRVMKQSDGSYTAVDGSTDVSGATGTNVKEQKYAARKDPVHKNAGDMTNAYVSLTKSFGGGLSVVAEYSTVSTTVSDFTKAHDITDAAVTAAGDGASIASLQNASLDDDEETTNKFLLSVVQTF